MSTAHLTLQRVSPWLTIPFLFAMQFAIVISTAAEGIGAEAPAERASTVILISLDGTRPQEITLDALPSLVAMAKRGLQADGLIPPTPANTFPSHVSMVTGVSPNRHGIVNNFFVDPEKGKFDKSEIPQWIEVEPLWSLLARQGVASASFHWVGSEGDWQNGFGPRDWRPFAAGVPVKEKVATILAWLDEPPSKHRPRFITSWFPGADHAGHLHGPGSEQAMSLLRRQDPALRSLIEGIEARDLWSSTTLIVVSDHGMAAAKTRLDFDRILNREGVPAWVTGAGGFAMVYLKTGPELKTGGPADPEAIRRVIQVAEEHGLTAVPLSGERSRPEFSHRRFGDLIVRAPLGTAIYRKGLPSGGFHGYDSGLVEMHGLFLALGRGVAPGRRISTVRAIDVAPTVLELLGLAVPSWMEGQPIALQPGASSK